MLQKFVRAVRRTAEGDQKQRNIKGMAVCLNLQEHLKGNIYIQFRNAVQAAEAWTQMNGLPIRGIELNFFRSI